jgi:hypothetical protein
MRFTDFHRRNHPLLIVAIITAVENHMYGCIIDKLALQVCFSSENAGVNNGSTSRCSFEHRLQHQLNMQNLLKPLLLM